MTATTKPAPWFPGEGRPVETEADRAEPERVQTSGVRELPLAQLHESPQNPRTTYAADALQDLAASIREVGILTPITVRPRAAGGFEIGAGHRRVRAAKLAGLTAVPAFIRALDDRAFLELLTIENLQRDDLHPLEEAQGYVALMQSAGYDVARISERVGRSVKYVYDRVKLLQLIKPAQKLFREGKFTAGHAILLARLSKEDQERAIDVPQGGFKVSGLFTEDLSRGEGELELDDEKVTVKPVSVREFAEWIDDHVRFVPAHEDLPQLFPATDVALKQAAEAEEKVVRITYDYHVPDDAKPDEGPEATARVYGPLSWKRADGAMWEEPRTLRQVKSKTCEHSVTGVIVIGPGRGQAFRVCIAKGKCEVHWPKPKAAKPGSKTESDWQARQRRQEARYQREQAEREAQRDQWKAAVPAILDATAIAVRKASAAASGPLAELLIDRLDLGPVDDDVPLGRSAEDLVRHLAFQILAFDIKDAWRQDEIVKALKAIGVDAKKILKAAAAKTKVGADPLSVKCPTCGAAPGTKCKRPSGHDVLNGQGQRGWHDARGTAAAKAAR